VRTAGILVADDSAPLASEKGLRVVHALVFPGVGTAVLLSECFLQFWPGFRSDGHHTRFCERNGNQIERKPLMWPPISGAERGIDFDAQIFPC
jgi:hypothetical protein